MDNVVTRLGLDHRVQRDRQNAEFVVEVARVELARLRPPQTDSRFGVTEFHKSRVDHLDRSRKALKAIADEAFHVMVEVYTKSANAGGKPLEKEQLWYANTSSEANEVLSSDGQSVNCACMDSSRPSDCVGARHRRSQGCARKRLSTAKRETTGKGAFR